MLENGRFRVYEETLTATPSAAETTGEALLEITADTITFWGIKR